MPLPRPPAPPGGKKTLPQPKPPAIALLPSQLSARGLASSNANSNPTSTATRGRNSPVLGGGRPSISTPASLSNSRSSVANMNATITANANANANASGAAAAGGAVEGGKGVPTKEEMEARQLKLTYQNYLHQGVLAILMNKLAKKGAQMSREKVGGPAVIQTVDALIKLKREYFYRDAWILMMEWCLTSSKLHDLFFQLKEQYVDGKEKTLNGLKIALEAQFDHIFIENAEEAGQPTSRAATLTEENKEETKIKADAELEVLIQRVKDYLTSLDGGDQPGAVGGRKLSEDNPEFLISFLQAISELIREHGAVSGCKKEATNKVSQIVSTTSGMITARSVKKQRRRRQKKREAQAKALAEANFVDDKTREDLSLDGNVGRPPRSPSASPIKLE